LRQAIEIVGSQAELARLGAITEAAINISIKTNWCGPKVAIAIETATKGRIKRSALRPDLWAPRKRRKKC